MRTISGRLTHVVAAFLAVTLIGPGALRSTAHAATLATRPIAVARKYTPPATESHVRPPSAALVSSGPLLYSGGPVQTAPVVYVVYWGWTSDPYGVQAYLNDFLSTVGGTTWLSTVTQYSGAGNPAGLYAGSWSDPSSVPATPVADSAIQSEALAAIQHFGLGTSVNIQIVVALPTGHDPTNFAAQGGDECAYHGAVAAYPNVTYTALPYMPDAGGSCGANLVDGPLDGVSILAGHELAESITDPLLNAWFDSSGYQNGEIADKCAWVGLQNLTTSGGTFAVQPLWSNALNGCVSALPAPIPFSDDNQHVACPVDTLTWPSVSGASGYQVWVKQSNAPSYSLAWTGSATHLNITLARGQSATYAGRACSSDNTCSALSNGDRIQGGTCE